MDKDYGHLEIRLMELIKERGLSQIPRSKLRGI